MGRDDCNQICVNTDGSYHCGCDDGYYLQTNNRTCQGMVWLLNLMFSFRRVISKLSDAIIDSNSMINGIIARLRCTVHLKNSLEPNI